MNAMSSIKQKIAQYLLSAAGGKKNQPTGTLSSQVVRRAVSRAHRDIADWKSAEQRTRSTDDPRYTSLQDLYLEITNDALLTSQINNRVEQTVAAPFELVDAAGTVNDEQTLKLRSLPCVTDIIRAILESEYYGYSLIEFIPDGETFRMANLPRRNIDPVFGRFFPDTTNDTHIKFREMPEYGKYILEFNDDQIGLLNKTVPHVLFKKFAQSCWSELCEIYGIPPRYLKTNTSDPQMLARGEQMMQDMGNAAAFVIDTNEEFSFADGTSTNGDVYKSLITLCNQEISMLISGAIIGQDTENGNYSKEQSSQTILERLCDSDKRAVETYMNSTVLPALVQLGWLGAGDIRFRFASVEDPDKLWTMVKEVLPYKDVDSKWLEEKFSIPVSDKAPMSDGLSALMMQHLTGGDPRFFG